NCVRQMRDSAGMRRRRPSGKTRHRQIKAPPEKMDRTALATKTRAEFFEHAIALDENAPEPIGVFAVVRTMIFIFIKRDRILDLVGHFVDGYPHVQVAQRLHYRLIKLRNRLRFQFDRSPSTIAFKDAQLVIDEIKADLERARAMRNRRSSQA